MNFFILSHPLKRDCLFSSRSVFISLCEFLPCYFALILCHRIVKAKLYHEREKAIQFSMALFSLHSIPFCRSRQGLGNFTAIVLRPWFGICNTNNCSGKEEFARLLNFCLLPLFRFTVFDVSSLCFPLSCLRPYYIM